MASCGTKRPLEKVDTFTGRVHMESKIPRFDTDYSSNVHTIFQQAVLTPLPHINDQQCVFSCKNGHPP